MKRWQIILSAALCLLSLAVLAQPIRVQAQDCFGPNQQPVPCPEDEEKKNKKPTPIPPTPTFTQTVTPTSTPTPTVPPTSTPTVTASPTATPLLGLAFPAPDPMQASCPTWPINTYLGLGLVLAGILSRLFGRSDIKTAYIGPHEMKHAQLNTTDEYTESGFGKIARAASFGLITGGGLLSLVGAAGFSGLLPCSPLAGILGPGVAIGIVAEILFRFLRSPQSPRLSAGTAEPIEEVVEIKEERYEDESGQERGTEQTTTSSDNPDLTRIINRQDFNIGEIERYDFTNESGEGSQETTEADTDDEDD